MDVNSLLHGYLADTSSPYTLDSKTSVYYYALFAAGNVFSASVAETATGTDALSALLDYSSGIAETATGTDQISGNLPGTFKPIVIFM